MRIGILGGTFDPIHIGHLIIAEQARIQASLDLIWFIPTHIPPHKKQRPRADNDHRWNMVQLATATHPYFQSLDIELNKATVSYSIDTIEELRKQYPDDDLYYLIGADMLADLSKWYRFSDLMREVRFLVFSRAGFALSSDAIPLDVRHRITCMPMPIVEVSSSHIRDSIARQQLNGYWLPDAVYAYVKEYRLYES